jgi:hypothetical protein
VRIPAGTTPIIGLVKVRDSDLSLSFKPQDEQIGVDIVNGTLDLQLGHDCNLNISIKPNHNYSHNFIS